MYVAVQYISKPFNTDFKSFKLCIIFILPNFILYDYSLKCIILFTKANFYEKTEMIDDHFL